MNAVQTINQIILDSLKQGFIPWKTFNKGFPTSVSTKKKYSGVNPILLQISAHKRFDRSFYWGTLNAWGSVDCQVPFGQEPTLIFVYQEFEKDHKLFKMPSTKKVFNADQAYGLSLGDFFVPKVLTNDYDKVESLLTKTDVALTEGLTPSYYDGTITMPPRNAFRNDAQYWSTCLHELCHHWEFKVGFTAEEPQRELVAEIATGYLEGILEFEHCTDRENHDKYLGQWLDSAERDYKYLPHSASVASKIVYDLMNLINPEEFSYES